MSRFAYLAFLLAGACAVPSLPAAVGAALGLAFCAHTVPASVVLWRRSRLRVLAAGPILSLPLWLFATFLGSAQGEDFWSSATFRLLMVASGFVAAGIFQRSLEPARSRWFWRGVIRSTRDASVLDLFALRYLPCFDGHASTQLVPRPTDGATRAAGQWALVWVVAYNVSLHELPQPLGMILLWSVFTLLCAARTGVIWNRTGLPLMTLASALSAMTGIILVALACQGRWNPNMPAWAWFTLGAGMAGMVGLMELEYRRHPGLKDAWLRHQAGTSWIDMLTLRNIPHMRESTATPAP